MMLPKRTIAIDLCNTVCDINGSLERYLCTVRKKGAYHIDGATPDFFLEHPEIFRDAEPFPYAAVTLRMLSDFYNIVYLTARPEEAHDATLDFLFKNGFPLGEIIFSKNKVDVFKQRSMVFAIDDAPHEIEAYTQAGITVLVKAWDYNKHAKLRFEWGGLYSMLKRRNQRYAGFFRFRLHSQQCNDARHGLYYKGGV